MNEAYIYDAVRIPRGRASRQLAVRSQAGHAGFPAVACLAAAQQPGHGARGRCGHGIVTPIGDQGGCLPRIAALAAGWDWRVSGVQINRFCAPGLDAINEAAHRVRSGWDDLIIAGGVESMSRVPESTDGTAWALDPRTSIDK